MLELQHLFDVDRSEENYASAIEGKTAALFATASGSAAWSPPSTTPRSSAHRFGYHLGMCFQVVDDVLDLTGTDETLGSPPAGPPRGHLHARP